LNYADALPQILLGGIPGAIAMGTTVIYDIEKWSILRVTVTHFLIVMVVTFLASFVLKWFEPWSTAFWIMLAVVAVGYFIVWLIIYRCYKKQIRKLNELLKESQEVKENHPQM
jgi:L-asparagine transporter-like permease